MRILPPGIAPKGAGITTAHQVDNHPLDVFFVGEDGALYVSWVINGGFWDAPTNRFYFDQWQPNPQVRRAPPAAGEPATLVTPHQQHVFNRGLDGAINHIFWDARTNRLYFDQWTSRTQAPLAVGDPATIFTI
ncbi:MAG: hypothetical protein ACREUZ_09985 [Burkholderiales bacterium]